MTPKKTDELKEIAKVIAANTLPDAKPLSVPDELQGGSVASRLTVYAPFDLGGRHYNAGDTFTAPAGYTAAPEFDKFRAMEKKNAGGTETGRAFVNDKTGRREILPVKEG